MILILCVAIFEYFRYNKLKDIEEINTQEVESEEEQKEEAPAQSTEKVKSYTASNGQTYDSIGILNIPSLNIQYPILS